MKLEDMARAVSSGSVPADHWVKEAVARIRADEAEAQPIRAFLSRIDAPTSATVARPTGAAVEGEGGTGTRPLEGVPVGVKDNLATLDLPTSCASKILEGYHSPYEATVVRRLRAAGGQVVGKTNMDEFGMGSSTENSAFGVTRNPWDRSRIPGGSSGGSAAAVAAGMVPCALGSDTGGSVRQPAAHCGVVGLKPTYGRVSRYGLVAYASSLDQVGTLARSVEDAAFLLEVIAGPDPLDATCARLPVPQLGRAAREGAVRGGAQELREGLRGRVVGLPVETLSDALDPAMRREMDRAIEALRAGGAEVREVSLPHTRFAVPTYYILAPAEASSNLARYDGVRYGVREDSARSTLELYRETRTQGFGPEVIRRIMLGTYALSAGYYDAYYGRAQKVRTLIARDFRRVFHTRVGGESSDGVDLLFTPTTPSPAFGLGERITDPVSMYLTDVFTVTANLAGIPGLSLPIGRVDGLPVGGQLLGPWWGEAPLVGAAAALESILGGGSDV